MHLHDGSYSVQSLYLPNEERRRKLENRERLARNARLKREREEEDSFSHAVAKRRKSMKQLLSEVERKTARLK